MDFMHPPKIGLRTIKTSIAVFLCLALFPNEPFFACMTAVICLQDTVAGSVRMGIVRGFGTGLGGLIGLFFLILCRLIDNNIPSLFFSKLFIYLLIAIGIIVVICSCNLLKKPTSIPICSIVFLGVTTAHAYKDPFFYAFNRMVETLFGILIAILVNKYITPPKEK